jgi:ABC-type microcin C transport system duplicated ATPase subunit YejF
MRRLKDVQEPMTALNPILPIGVHVMEGMELHPGLPRAIEERHACLMQAHDAAKHRWAERGAAARETMP